MTDNSKEQPMEKLKQATNLQDQIRELDHFLHTINPHWNVQRGSGSWDIDVVLKTRTEKQLSIFASRWFGIGTHKSEIRIPNTILDELYDSITKRRNELQDQFNQIIP